MAIDGCLRGSRRSHNQKEETIRDTNKRFGIVSTDKLLKLECNDGWVEVHDERREFHEGKNTLVTNNHSEGLEQGHRTSSQKMLDRRLAELEIQLEVMEEFVQRNMEDQRYGWILQRKGIKWIQLQRILNYKERVQLKEALREAKLQQRKSVEKEALKPCDFKANDWCMYVGVTSLDYVGQSLRTFTPIKER